MRNTYDVYQDIDGLLYATAVNVPADALGDDMDAIFEAVEQKGFARYGSGASPLFHIEKCRDPQADLDTASPRYEVESLMASA